ncbi:MAG: DUF4440 domain-containing protein [Actinobacteria bacterium]|nr:MAG: DUF4440 domain-containing protein [Actinomycetota bacterium]
MIRDRQLNMMDRDGQLAARERRRDMTEQEIRQKLQDWADAWNSGDEKRIEDFYAKDVVLYQAPVSRSLTGREHLIARLRDFQGLSEEGKLAVRNTYVDGNTGIIEVSVDGTNTGPFLEYPPTNSPFHLETCLIMEFAGDKIIKHTTYLDTASVLRALGHIEIKGTRTEAA